MRKYYIYIMNSPTGTIYVGMTNDLPRRVYEHKHKLIEGFTKKYNISRLAYFEETPDVYAAINREKEIKGWRRSKKIELIKSMNPKWEDLAADWFDEDNH
jgi:putative endonuclease